MKKQIQIAVMLAVLSSSQAFSAGFEKSVFWDAHYAAIAGAAQSSVTGPQALYWNPAALAGSPGLQVNADFSPTWAQYSGPQVLNSNTVQNSNTKFLPVGAGFISYGVTPQWGIGVGYYVTAGSAADYDSVTPGSLSALGITYAPPIKGDLSVTELSIGTGYELLPGLKLGAGYRLVFVSATLDTAGVVQPLGTPASSTIIASQINSISPIPKRLASRSRIRAQGQSLGLWSRLPKPSSVCGRRDGVGDDRFDWRLWRAHWDTGRDR